MYIYKTKAAHKYGIYRIVGANVSAKSHSKHGKRCKDVHYNYITIALQLHHDYIMIAP